MRHLRFHTSSSSTFCGLGVDALHRGDTIIVADTDCKTCLSIAVEFGERLAKQADNRLRKLAGQEPKL